MSEAEFDRRLNLRVLPIGDLAGVSATILEELLALYRTPGGKPPHAGTPGQRRTCRTHPHERVRARVVLRAKLVDLSADRVGRQHQQDPEPVRPLPVEPIGYPRVPGRYPHLPFGTGGWI